MADLKERLSRIQRNGDNYRIFRDARDFLEGKLSEISSSISSLPELLKKTIFHVHVDNQDTNLIKEIAENTRKSAARSKELVDRSTQVQKVELSSPVTLNVPEFPPFPSEIKVNNLKDLVLKSEVIDISGVEIGIKSLEKQFSRVADQLPSLKAKDIVFPKIEIPKQVSVKESKDIIKALVDGLQGVRDDLSEVYKAIESKEVPQVHAGGTSVVSTSSKVSDVGIKALRGVAKTTAVTVTSSPTELPADALLYRRSVIVFNNSSVTIYIGGSDVTTATGLPVPTQSYSPPVDAGQHMPIYAIAASGNNNVRVFEVSSEREGA